VANLGTRRDPVPSRAPRPRDAVADLSSRRQRPCSRDEPLWRGYRSLAEIGPRDPGNPRVCRARPMGTEIGLHILQRYIGIINRGFWYFIQPPPVTPPADPRSPPSGENYSPQTEEASQPVDNWLPALTGQPGLRLRNLNRMPIQWRSAVPCMEAGLAERAQQVTRRAAAKRRNWRMPTAAYRSPRRRSDGSSRSTWTCSRARRP
jgi:hypothetical protein